MQKTNILAYYLLILVQPILSSNRLNSTFGSNSDGIVTALIGSNAQANSHAIDASGNIFATGSATTNNVQSVIITKYSSSGVIDTSFGTNGVVTTTLGTYAVANDVVLDSGNNIIITGTATISGVNNLVLVKYNSSGTVLTTLTGVISDGATGNSMSIDSNGNVVVAGNVTANGQVSGLISRYSSNLILDTSFATNGHLIVQSPAYHTFFNSMQIDTNGNVVVGASSSNADFFII